MKRFGLLCAALCLVAAFATACGGSSNTTEERETGTATMTASPTGTAEATSGPAAASAATITIANMSFGDAITVPPGAAITIKNDDSAEHSVTSDTAGKFDVEVEGKEQGTLTAPTEPGEYAFHCTYHPSMHGTLIVK
ncbi:MAG TPA: cupredoxin domain-containing protein [Mycobacterium sp.]|jgi:plastocyanin|nr:cupredoxin domain-containing protein [Mycobacterium sp.]